MNALKWTLLAALMLTARVAPGLEAGPLDTPSPALTGRKVFVLPVKGTIDQSMLYIFRRAFREIERMQPDAVIVELDTPGGRLLETREIIQWLRSLKPRIPVYAFVNPNAYSAGAIICLGTTQIFMCPAAHIGDAMPILINPLSGGVQELPEEIREKMISPTRALVRGLAQENGYDENLAEAMVDPDREFKAADVSCPKGELLTLTSQEAVSLVPPDNRPLLASALVNDIPELLEHVNLAGAQIVRFDEVGAERLARWITGLGPLLLGLAVLALFIEFKTPGFGIFGISGIILLCIYFFGHYIAGLAGYEEIILVFVGIALLAIEVLVIPGFGIIGIMGIILIVGGSIMTLIPVIPTNVPVMPGIENISIDSLVMTALYKFSTTSVLVVIGAWLLGKILPKTHAYHKLILGKTLEPSQGFVIAAGRFDMYLGRTGSARTALRPAGTGQFETERLDVVTSGDHIDKGATIRVIRVEGNRIVVEAAPDAVG